MTNVIFSMPKFCISRNSNFLDFNVHIFLTVLASNCITYLRETICLFRIENIMKKIKHFLSSTNLMHMAYPARVKQEPLSKCCLSWVNMCRHTNISDSCDITLDKLKSTKVQAFFLNILVFFLLYLSIFQLILFYLIIL